MFFMPSVSITFTTLFLTSWGAVSLFLCYSFFEVTLLLKKMTIEQHKDNESIGEANGLFHDLHEPLILPGKDDVGSCKDIESNKRVENGPIGMVLLSTFVAVCGSFAFGTCVSIFTIYEMGNTKGYDTKYKKWSYPPLPLMILAK